MDPFPEVVPVPDLGSPTVGTQLLAFARSWVNMANWLPQLIAYLNTIGLGGFVTNSTTSMTVAASGAVAFTVEAGKAFQPGSILMVAYTTDPDEYMVVRVVTYNPTTGAVTGKVLTAGGVGATRALWTVTITAIPQLVPTVGTVYTGLTEPTDGTWIELGTGAYLKSAYATLAALLGDLVDRPEAVRAWSNSTTATAAIVDIAYTGARFIGCGGAELRDLGTDGNSFTAITGHGSTTLNVIATNGVAGGGNITMLYMSSGTATVRSVDGGLTTAAGGTVPAGNYNNAAYGHSQFVAMGTNLCATSPDGSTAHTARTFAGTPVPRLLRPLASTDTWILPVNGGNVKRSTDNCVTFGADIPTGLSGITGIAVRGNFVILFGTLNSLPAAALSRDGGLTWRVTFNGFIGSAAASTMGGAVQIGGLVVATTGAAGTSALGLLVTTDGEHFMHVPSGAALGGASVIAAGNGRLVATNTTATNPIQRTPLPLMSYSTATQFAVPASNAPIGMRQWIKAAL